MLHKCYIFCNKFEIVSILSENTITTSIIKYTFTL